MHHVAVVAGLMGGNRGFLVHHGDVNVHRLLQTASYRQPDDAGADNSQFVRSSLCSLSYVGPDRLANQTPVGPAGRPDLPAV